MFTQNEFSTSMVKCTECGSSSCVLAYWTHKLGVLIQIVIYLYTQGIMSSWNSDGQEKVCIEFNNIAFIAKQISGHCPFSSASWWGLSVFFYAWLEPCSAASSTAAEIGPILPRSWHCMIYGQQWPWHETLSGHWKPRVAMMPTLSSMRQLSVFDLWRPFSFQYITI